MENEQLITQTSMNVDGNYDNMKEYVIWADKRRSEHEETALTSKGSKYGSYT